MLHVLVHALFCLSHLSTILLLATAEACASVLCSILLKADAGMSSLGGAWPDSGAE